MNTGRGRHVLAHVVQADAHKLHRIERAAPEVRRHSGMGGTEIPSLILLRRNRRYLIGSADRSRGAPYASRSLAKISTP